MWYALSQYRMSQKLWIRCSWLCAIREQRVAVLTICVNLGNAACGERREWNTLPCSRTRRYDARTSFVIVVILPTTTSAATYTVLLIYYGLSATTTIALTLSVAARNHMVHVMQKRSLDFRCWGALCSSLKCIVMTFLVIILINHPASSTPIIKFYFSLTTPPKLSPHFSVLALWGALRTYRLP